MDMKRRCSRVKEHVPKETVHDIIIRYVSLCFIVALFILDVFLKIQFDYYEEAYAGLGIFILFGKQDILAVLKALRK